MIDQINKEIVPYLKKTIADELKKQGHRDTGALEDDADVTAKYSGDGVLIEGYYQYYAKFVNQGVKASSIRKSKFAGAAIEALTKWGQRKGFENPKAAAFAIRQKQAKEGMPTRGSYRFSSNGKRLDAFDDVLNSKVLSDKIDQVVGVALEKTFNSLIKRNKDVLLSD